MHFSVEARLGEVPAFLNRLIGITGAAVWQRREHDFEQQLRDNPLIKRYLDERFPVERAMIYARHYRKRTGRYPSILGTADHDIGGLYSFAATAARVHTRLPSPAQNALTQKLVGAFKDQNGLAPLVFEMRTATHFMAKGFKVHFHDLCHGGGF
jgi:hypothetical protein